MTTRAAAKSFFKDGTNRAMLRFTLINHLCTDLEALKDTDLPPDRIRQDLSAHPGETVESSLTLAQAATVEWIPCLRPLPIMNTNTM